MYNPTDSNSIFETLGMMNKANAYDILVGQFKELKIEKVRLEQREIALTNELLKIRITLKAMMVGVPGSYNEAAKNAIANIERLTATTTTEANVPAANPDDLKDLNTFNI